MYFRFRFRAPPPPPPSHLSSSTNGHLINSAHMTLPTQSPGYHACLIYLPSLLPYIFPCNKAKQHGGGFHAPVPLDTLFLLPGRPLPPSPARPTPLPRAPIHPAEPSLDAFSLEERREGSLLPQNPPFALTSLHSDHQFLPTSPLPDSGLELFAEGGGAVGGTQWTPPNLPALVNDRACIQPQTSCKFPRVTCRPLLQSWGTRTLALGGGGSASVVAQPPRPPSDLSSSLLRRWA
jgi:hypothetical protein